VSIVAKSIKPTIKGSFVEELLAGYESQGRNGNALLESVGIKIANNNAIRLSVAQYTKLMAGIEQQLEDEMLGFLHKPVPLGSIGMLCELMVSLPNINAAVEAYNNFYALFNGGNSLFDLSMQGKIYRLTLNFTSVLQKKSPYFAQSMLLTIYKLLCWLANAKIEIQTIAFAMPVGSDTNELGYVFDCAEVLADAGSDFLEMSSDVLALPITQSKESAKDYAANSMLYALLWSNADDLESKIRAIIGEDISKGFPDFNAVAKKLDISTQTLSRRLHDRGATYQLIKDNTRRDAAIALLTNSKLTIKEIAYQVGFKETSSFSKAFKQWVGVSPSDYRVG